MLIEEIGTKGHTNLNKIELDAINSSLSSKIDLTPAKVLNENVVSASCYQGQTHGHKGFLLSPEKAQEFLKTNSYSSVIFPYLAADELLRSKPPSPQRYVIDFHPLDVISARKFKKPFARVESRVLPTRQESADKEDIRNREKKEKNPKAKVNRHHANFLNKWWLLSYPRGELISKIDSLDRYIACARVTKRPIFEFISSDIRPNDALQIFALEDDYSFGILQSVCHWEWFKGKCSTLKDDFRYTSKTVFGTFPWPQKPTLPQARTVAKAARELREFRNKIMNDNDFCLRELYRTLETPGANPLRNKHVKLDKAVMKAYGMTQKGDPLKFLLELNLELAEKESQGENVTAPGLPPSVENPDEFITDDCVRV